MGSSKAGAHAKPRRVEDYRCNNTNTSLTLTLTWGYDPLGTPLTRLCHPSSFDGLPPSLDAPLAPSSSLLDRASPDALLNPTTLNRGSTPASLWGEGNADNGGLFDWEGRVSPSPIRMGSGQHIAAFEPNPYPSGHGHS